MAPTMATPPYGQNDGDDGDGQNAAKQKSTHLLLDDDQLRGGTDQGADAARCRRTCKAPRVGDVFPCIPMGLVEGALAKAAL